MEDMEISHFHVWNESLLDPEAVVGDLLEVGALFFERTSHASQTHYVL